MLALQAWSCSNRPSKHAKMFRVVCRMNGACLGSIPDEASETCTRRLRCLQLRASKLMPHATRTPRYLKLYVEGCLITPKEFVYKTWLTRQQTKLAKYCLGAADSLSLCGTKTTPKPSLLCKSRVWRTARCFHASSKNIPTFASWHSTQATSTPCFA